MIIDPATLDRRQRHQLLLSTVAPRPIAWVSTRGLDGSYNLAPFSYFQALCSTPPYLIISVGKRAGNPKDTLRNIQDTGEYVVNLVPETLADLMNLSAGEYTAEVDEFALSKLTPLTSQVVSAPRVAESPVNLEVKLWQLLPLPGSDYTAVIGEVVRWHVSGDVLTSQGLIDIARLRPICRLAQDDYVTFGNVFSMARPKV